MDTARFEKFDKALSIELPNAVDNILGTEKGKKPCAVGFITTDDFYGFYLSWEYVSEIYEYYNWKNSFESDFLYSPLVAVVDETDDIDLCERSDEKWEFAKALLSVLEKNIKALPDEFFAKNGYKRDDVLFFATMSDGDYVEEMLSESVKMFNSSETLKGYGFAE